MADEYTTYIRPDGDSPYHVIYSVFVDGPEVCGGLLLPAVKGPKIEKVIDMGECARYFDPGANYYDVYAC